MKPYFGLQDLVEPIAPEIPLEDPSSERIHNPIAPYGEFSKDRSIVTIMDVTGWDLLARMP